MTAVAPKSLVQHLAVVLRQRLEAAQLPVGDGLPDESDQEQRGADGIQPVQSGGGVGGAEQRQRDYGSQHRLQAEDDVEALEPKVRFVVAAYGLVAMVLMWAAIAPGEVKREPERPDK